MFTEDLTAFFDTVNGFAETVTYNGSSELAGIFDNAYVKVDLGTGVESRHPAVVMRAADVPDVAHGDTIVRDGTTYHVIGVEPDGAGVVVLLLEKQ